MIAVGSIRRIGRGEGLLLSRVEYVRLADVLDALCDAEWSAPTDCDGWDVKAVAAHVLGGLEGVRVPRELVRQYRAARRLGYDEWTDALNEVQVRSHATDPPREIATRLRGLIEPALRMRARTPLPLRRLVRVSLPVAGRVPLSWVLDVVYTRDTFLHRVDVCRATGRDLVVDEIEQRIVADVVAEWAARHGEPFVLRLTGPAGATYSSGDGGTEIECDAVEFTRLVSGRGTPRGLLTGSVQF